MYDVIQRQPASMLLFMFALYRVEVESSEFAFLKEIELTSVM